MSLNFSDRTVMIDGSHGEGGGQILRTALSLSCVTGRPVEITNIRKARSKPGLQPQHLTAVRAAAAVSRARVEGAEPGSTRLRFLPERLHGGEYVLDVAETRGSAGSTSLVLQTIIPPLCLARRPSRVTVKGGTHVPWSPSYHYLKHVFAQMIGLLGGGIELDIEKWGWYPAGGGLVTAKLMPVDAFSPITATERGRLLSVRGVSAVANLPEDIADRQRRQAMKLLGSRGIDGVIEIVSAPSPGRGTLFFLLAEFENVVAGFDSLGAIGKRAEQVADEACRNLFAYLDARGALEPNLADQIVPYLVLAAGASEFTTTRITRHLLTNIWVVKQFLNLDIQVEGSEGEEGRVKIIAGSRVRN